LYVDPCFCSPPISEVANSTKLNLQPMLGRDEIYVHFVVIFGRRPGSLAGISCQSLPLIEIDTP
jgi:hypothetical protein